MKTEHDAVFSMEIIPYYALFVQSFQEYIGKNFLPDSIALKIKDIRNHIKSYGTYGYGKSSKNILSIDEIQDDEFKPKFSLDYLKLINDYSNLGTYWTDNGYIIGNTQLLADFLELKKLDDPKLSDYHLEFGKQIGNFVASVRNGIKYSFEPPIVNRLNSSIQIQKFCDVNSNVKNCIFVDNLPKELNLFLLHLLCNMNFVKHIIIPLFADKNKWAFRVEYIVTYYTFNALKRLKNYCDNNDYSSLDLAVIKALNDDADGLFQSKFRNCMMHYGLENRDVLSVSNIKKPFYGIVENCFDGMDYYTYSNNLRTFSNKIINLLESIFDFSNMKFELL